jgi:hypothetical protein
MWFLGDLVCGWQVRWIANSSWPEGTGTSGTITVVDSGAALVPKRFYRVHLAISTQH